MANKEGDARTSSTLQLQTGKAFSLTVYEDANAAEAAGQRMQARPADRRVGVEPDTVEWLDAHPF
ncbi:MAG: hypothetical protein ACLP4R_06780 [Solirubrobacteraceae bacterium]